MEEWENVMEKIRKNRKEKKRKKGEKNKKIKKGSLIIIDKNKRG